MLFVFLLHNNNIHIPKHSYYIPQFYSYLMLLSWVIWHLGRMTQNNHKIGHFYPFLFSFKTSLPFFFLLWFSLLYATYLSLSKLIFLYLLPSLTIVKAHHNFDDLQLGMFVAREYFRFWLSFDLFF